MINNNDYILCSSLDDYKGWAFSSKAKKLAKISTPNGPVLVKLIELERTHKTIKKIALAILLTIGTAFFGLFNQKIRDLWTGKELIKIALKQSAAELAAFEILCSPYGFTQELIEDLKHEYKQITFTECHGRIELRQKVVSHLLTPSALSIMNLRQFSSINPPLYITLLIKRVAHAFSLQGAVKLQNSKVSLEGFNETFTIPMLSDSLMQFAKVGKIHPSCLEWIQKILAEAVWHDNVTNQKIDFHHKSIQTSQTTTPSLLGTGYDWHSNQVIIYDGLLFLADRSGKGEIPGIAIYQITDKQKITKQFLTNLVARRESKKNDCITSYIHTATEKNLLARFGLRKVSLIPMKQQKAGNCTYTSFKAALYVLLSIYEKRNHPELSWEKAFESKRAAYKEFSSFDKELVLKDFLNELLLPSKKMLKKTAHKLYLRLNTTKMDLIVKYIAQGRLELFLKS